MATGVVKFFLANRGYGFIVPDAGGPDMFLHLRGIIDDEPPVADDRVEYDVKEYRGRPTATNCRKC